MGRVTDRLTDDMTGHVTGDGDGGRDGGHESSGLSECFSSSFDELEEQHRQRQQRQHQQQQQQQVRDGSVFEVEVGDDHGGSGERLKEAFQSPLKPSKYGFPGEEEEEAEEDEVVSLSTYLACSGRQWLWAGKDILWAEYVSLNGHHRCDSE